MYVKEYYIKDDLPDLYAEKRDKTPDKSTTNIESKILEDLTPLDVRVLVHSEVEFKIQESNTVHSKAGLRILEIMKICFLVLHIAEF